MCLLKILWYIVLFILCFINYIYFRMKINLFPSYEPFFKESIGVFYNYNEFKEVSYLKFYQYFITLYTFISFMQYDYKNSPDFIYTRISKNKCLIERLFVVLIFIFIIRTIYFVTNYFLFNEFVKITMKSYIIQLLINFAIVFIYFFYKLIVTNLNNRKVR